MLLASLPASCWAQSFVLDLPLRSQAAEVSQTIGITDITINYHRPLVNGRKIWDGLVPYGKVWRTGANVITTVRVSDPVMIEGKPLDRGVYGLHIIPNADAWTIIFSKNSTSWGSFTYDQSEDVLRIEVKPQPAEMHEALTFEFDHLQPDSAVIELEWDKIVVPLKVSVDVHALTAASLKRQLRTLVGFTWIGWIDAADYLLSEKFDLDDALVYADKSIKIEDRFDSEVTKSRILALLNRSDEAKAARKRALELATPSQTHELVLKMLTDKENDEAFPIIRENASKHPDQWFVHEDLARMYSAQNQSAKAEAELNVAIKNAPASEKSSLDELMKRLRAGQEINQ
jgi:tetratricopeptide (TPR) repeat protein